MKKNLMHLLAQLWSRLMNWVEWAARQLSMPTREALRGPLALQALEDRILLSSFYWIGSQSSDSQNPNNWQDEQGVPGLPQKTDTIYVGKDFRGLPAFPINNLIVTANLTVERFELLVPRRGILGFPQTLSIATGKTLTVTDEFDQFGGTINGGGKGVTTEGEGRIVVSENAEYFWLSGSIHGTRVDLLSGAGMLITGSAVKDFTKSKLLNAGIVTWSGSGSITGRDFLVSNLSGSEFVAQPSSRTATIGSPSPNKRATDPSFPVFTVSSGGRLLVYNQAPKPAQGLTLGVTIFGSFQNNGGEVDVNRGDLILPDITYERGKLSISSGASIQLGGESGSSHEFQEGSSVTGSGELVVLGGAKMIVADDLDVSNLTLFSPKAELTGDGLLTVGGLLDWNGGIMSGSGETLIGPNGKATITFGTLDGRLLGIAAKASATVRGVLNFTNGGSVFNAGTFDIATDDIAGPTIRDSGAAGVFISIGVLRKTSGSGASTIAVPFAGYHSTLDDLSGKIKFTRPILHEAGNWLLTALGV
jgi:hypothetical protein